MVSRRELLTWLGAVVAASAVPSVGCSSDPAVTPQTGFFTDQERAALNALANAVIPPDDTPGGAALGAVAYIEKLLTALDGPAVPRIYAGGPFSGRQPFADGTTPPNEFADFLELDRVSLVVWTRRVTELKQQVKDGIKAALENAPPGPIDKLDQGAVVDWFRGLGAGFRDLFIDLVCQAAFSAPEYGGNVGLAGWKLCNYEGDNLPLGYSIWDDAKKAYRERPEAPMSTANPGPDPMPLSADVRAILDKFVAALGGKVAP